MSGAKVESLATGILDLDGVWEVNFQDVTGALDFPAVPRQAFFTVWRGRLLGQDGLGVIWRGEIRWQDEGHVHAFVVFYPTEASETAQVIGIDGVGRRESARHAIILDVVTEGDNTVLMGALDVGAVRIRGNVKRLRRFDGATI